MKAKYIRPEVGQTYILRSGVQYRCLWVSNVDRVEQGECTAVLVRDKDGYELTAHGIQQYEDGLVEWNFSTGGHWTNGFFRR